MSSLSIHLNGLSAYERDQIADLLLLANINPIIYDQAAQNTYSIEIGLNTANASALEGILKYITTYIYKGVAHDSNN
jgi:hypothetical protein|tara:strand:- start:407 stop:637 length:231 start_codon:yes stop_codon:yes gene_type:complete